MGLSIPNAPRTGEKNADRNAGRKAATPVYIACTRVVIACACVVIENSGAHARRTPPPPEAACDEPQSLSWGQMIERNLQQMKDNSAKLTDPVRNAGLESYLHCRRVNEPDGGSLAPSSAQPVGRTAASASAASPQLPVESRPAVALEDPKSLDTNEEDGLEDLAPEEEMTAPMLEAPPRPLGMTVIQRGRCLRISTFGARSLYLEPGQALGRQGG